LLRRVLWFTDVSVVLASSIIMAMMEAASTSETSVNFYHTTPRNNPEKSHLQLCFMCFRLLICVHMKRISGFRAKRPTGL
jgi:hypothetical protein